MGIEEGKRISEDLPSFGYTESDIKNPTNKLTPQAVYKIIKLIQANADNMYDLEWKIDTIEIEPATDAQGDKWAQSKPGNQRVSFTIKRNEITNPIT